MATGKIGVTTENIFPVIKKFLYSDHEIFLRELVSNAVDATRKLRALSSFGDYKGELGEMRVDVRIDREAGTLTVSDHGIGMDAADIEKYINQIAFSGAEEFLKKYKDTATNIIGHFGLGFYSAFMVSKKVEILSLSYREGAKPVRWTCDGSPEYTMTDEGVEKAERGTDVILYLDDDSREFLEQARIDTLLKKYCRFLPVPVVSGKEQEWKDGKMVDTDRDKIINATEPLWTRKPSDLTDEDYIRFYHELMPAADDPMFWIHLNVDYPFTLTGVLYFPKIKNNLDIRKDRIQLYCNQVYVTDQVEGVVPEFMTLMQGVIDSPDIPLNVSRSYLQADTAVKKISAYISKKVAERLASLFKDDRATYEKKWDDIRIFIEYGMLTDPKFCDAAMKFVLLRDTEGQYFTLEEYKKLVEPEQTDKEGNIIYLYATDPAEQYAYIQAARDKGYNVLLIPTDQITPHFISMLEQKLEKTRLVRVDADIVDNLIRKDDRQDAGLTPLQTDILSTVFRTQIPKVEKADFIVDFQAMGETAAPATVTQNEFMRRMKEMNAGAPGMNFYGELPDSYTLVVNTSHPAVKAITEAAVAALTPTVEPLRTQIDDLNKAIADTRKKAEENADKKPTTDQAETIKADETKVADLRGKEEKAESEYAVTQPKIRQVIDLALLSAGLLRGEPLTAFLRRTAAQL